MKAVAVEVKWFQFRQRIIDWQKRQDNTQLAMAARAEEHSISILQKRYGYGREQAISELHKHYPKAWLG